MRRLNPGHTRIGVLAALGAYTLWGLFPLYLKLLQSVPALQIVLHRAVWSALFMLGLMAALGRFAWLMPALRSPGTVATFALTAALVSTNWLLYVWAVNHGRVLDASLGYFINPLVNVLLGTLVLGEALRRSQWLAVALAATGVAWLAWAAGGWPWVSLGLALSFGLYGLVRKTAQLGAAEGLTLETLLISAVCIPVLGWQLASGTEAFVAAQPSVRVLLMLAGPATAIPLLLFAMGARRVSLGTLGFLQYLSPSLQFALGVFVYGEPFDASRAIGFGFIWAALALYSVEGLLAARTTSH